MFQTKVSVFEKARPLYFFIGGGAEATFRSTPTPNSTHDDMKERICRACTEITPQMLAEVRWSFHQRINKCLQVQGHQFEHLL